MNKIALKAQLKGIYVNTDLRLICAFIFLLWSITRFFFLPFRPICLQILISREIQWFSQQWWCVAWLYFPETQSEPLMTDSLLLSFASWIQRKWNLSGAEPQAVPVPLIWVLSSRLTGVLAFHHLVHWQKEKGAAALLGTSLQPALLQNKQTIYF